MNINYVEWYYARVSTKHQNTDRQIAQFQQLGADERHIIIDKQSGKDFNREGYQLLKKQLLRSGDTLTVISLDRLGRNKSEIKKELDYFKENNIRLKVLDIPTTLTDYPEGSEWILDLVNNILIEVYSSLAEAERDKILTRQAEGIKEAKKKNVKFGRPSAEVPKEWNNIIDRWNNKEITAVEAMKELNLTKSTFYNLVKRMNTVN